MIIACQLACTWPVLARFVQPEYSGRVLDRVHDVIEGMSEPMNVFAIERCKKGLMKGVE